MAAETLARFGPYAERLAENDYVQENLLNAAQNLRDAYERSRKRRVKAARDEKFRAQIQAAAASAGEAGRALVSGREKRKKSWGRRLFLLLGFGALAAGAAVAANKRRGAVPPTADGSGGA